jgi:hypothetical protein
MASAYDRAWASIVPCENCAQKHNSIGTLQAFFRLRPATIGETGIELESAALNSMRFLCSSGHKHELEEMIAQLLEELIVESHKQEVFEASDADI